MNVKATVNIPGLGGVGGAAAGAESEGPSGVSSPAT